DHGPGDELLFIQFLLEQFLFGLFTFDDDGNEIGYTFNIFHLDGRWRFDGGVINGEGCQHFSPTVQDRYRPASAETEAEGEVTVAFPKRVGCNIGNDDCFLAIHGGAAAACAGADGQAVDGVSIDRREAPRREEVQAAAILV